MREKREREGGASGGGEELKEEEGKGSLRSFLTISVTVRIVTTRQTYSD